MRSSRECVPKDRSIPSLVLSSRARTARPVSWFSLPSYSLQKHLQQRVNNNADCYPKQTKCKNS